MGPEGVEEGKGLSGGRLTIPPKSHLVGGIRGIAPPGQLESPQPSWTEASLEEGQVRKVLNVW